MATDLATRAGWLTAHSMARMPPIDPPITAANCSMPSRSASAASAAT